MDERSDNIHNNNGTDSNGQVLQPDSSPTISNNSSTNMSSHSDSTKEEHRLTRNVSHHVTSNRKWLSHCLHKSLWSISTLMLLVLVLGVALTGLAIWITCYFVNLRGTNVISKRTQLIVTKAITDHITEKAVNQALEILLSTSRQLDVAEGQGFNVTNDNWGRRNLIAIFTSHARYSLLASIRHGREDGYFTAVGRFPSGEFRLALSDGNGTLFNHHMNPDTLEYDLSGVLKGFFATQRDWYYVAERANKTSWAPIFIAFSDPPVLSTGVSKPVFRNGAMYGVLSVSLELEQISRFLKELVDNTTNMRVMILQENYSVVGVSRGNTVEIIPTTDDDPTRGLREIHSSNLSDPVVRETSYQLQIRYGNTLNVPTYTTFQYKDSYRVQRLVALNPIRSPENLSWIVVVVSCKSDITGAIDTANKITLAIGITAIILSAIVALLIGFLITLPLKSVSKQMKQIAQMDFDSQFTNSLKLYEVDNMVCSMKKMQSAFRNFEKYVPANVVKIMIRRSRTVQLGVSSRLLSVLFLDIKDFTTLSETTDPLVLVALLEDFFTHMGSIISYHSGVIDKYLGDCIMALFNAPLDVPDHQYMAVAAAIEMQKRLVDLNQEWEKRSFPHDIHVRVGINTDTCLVGIVGSSTRICYTALGSGVSLASRLESLNKRFESKIILGENTYQSVHGRIACLWLASICKGTRCDAIINTYSVVGFKNGLSSRDMALCSAHEELKLAIERKDFENAKELCRASLMIDASDLAAADRLRLLEKPDFDESMLLIQLD